MTVEVFRTALEELLAKLHQLVCGELLNCNVFGLFIVRSLLLNIAKSACFNGVGVEQAEVAVEGKASTVAFVHGIVVLAVVQ